MAMRLTCSGASSFVGAEGHAQIPDTISNLRYLDAMDLFNANFGVSQIFSVV